LEEMIQNTATILGIEWLAAAQGIDFHRPLRTSPHLATVQSTLRAVVPFYDHDRFLAPDIETAKQLVLAGIPSQACRALCHTLWSDSP